jgi:hypothetical protein
MKRLIVAVLALSILALPTMVVAEQRVGVGPDQKAYIFVKKYIKYRHAAVSPDAKKALDEVKPLIDQYVDDAAQAGFTGNREQEKKIIDLFEKIKTAEKAEGGGS